jgi:hypothetical protein
MARVKSNEEKFKVRHSEPFDGVYTERSRRAGLILPHKGGEK